MPAMRKPELVCPAGSLRALKLAIDAGTERDALLAAGVTRLRLSPSSQHFGAVISAFDAVMNRSANADEALALLRSMSLPGGLVNGFAHARPGMEWTAMQESHA